MNYYPSIIILIGLLIIFIEAIVPGVYAPAIGIGLMVYGICLYFIPNYAVFTGLLAGIITIVILHILVYRVGNNIKVGPEKYIGRVIILDNDLDNEGHGIIKVDYEKWHVKCNKPLKKGTKVKIVGIDGVSLVIVPVENGDNEYNS